MSRTRLALRLRIAELRTKLMNDRSLHRQEEEHLLREIEELRGSVHGAPHGTKDSDVVVVRQRGARHAAKAMGSERRRHERFDVEVPIRFTVLALPPDEKLIARAHQHSKGRKVDEFTADVAESSDLSEGGIRFTAEIPLPEGSLVLIEVPFHGKGTRTLRAKAEIIWHRPGGVRWETAARFVGLDRVTREWLSHLRVTFSP